MALAHGGRIVPILAGHDQHPNSTPRMHLLDNHAMPPQLHQSLLPIQQHDSATHHSNVMDQASLEMPCLKEHGLFALPTEGDGNCLYYSLSDQLYADVHYAHSLRQLLADHMLAHKQYFMQFVVAEGGERRRPKRAAASAYATRSADVSAPTKEDKERRFEEMVASTRKNGEWGSSEHLQAFCQVFQVDVNVYTMNGVQVFRDVNALPDDKRNAIHVAFHDFKHYSSVRVIGGCHTGLLANSKCAEHPATHHPPGVGDLKVHGSLDTKDKAALKDEAAFDLSHLSDNPPMAYSEASLSTDHPSTTTTTTAAADTASSADSDLALDVFPPWDIQSIQDGLGGRYDRDTIVDMLQKCRGDIDRAFAALLGDKNDGNGEKKLGTGLNIKPSLQVSRSSSPFSTGSKRSADDSDDSEDPRPPVRRVRPKRRIVSNLTLGVGISFCDDQNEVVSLNLRMKDDAEKAALEACTGTIESSEASDSGAKKGPRRSGRLSKSCALSPGD